MSIHANELDDINNFDQEYNNINYDKNRKKIDLNNVGGPPMNNTNQHYQNDQDLFNRVQNSINNVCGSEGPNAGSLCRASTAGDVIFSQPFSCMIDLIQNYSSCFEDIPQDKVEESYNVFKDITGWNQPNLANIFNSVDENFENLVNFNSFYMFAPVLFLFFIIIWLNVGFGRTTWELGLFFTVLVVVILYGFSIAYRVHFDTYLRNRSRIIQQELNQSSTSFQNSIAYWPQALFATACTITCDSNCWKCNGSGNCPPCRPNNVVNNTPSIKRKSKSVRYNRNK